MNNGEEFDYTFRSKNDLPVYAGNALNMTVEVPRYSFYGETYPITIKIKNVSNTPVYDLEHRITRFEQGVYTTYREKNGSTYTDHKTLQLDGGNTYPIGTLEPGETVTIILEVTDLWKSMLQQNVELAKMMADYGALVTSFGANPYLKAANLFCSVISSVLSEVNVANVLKNVTCTTLEGSTTEVPFEVIITDIPDSLKEKYSSDFFRAITKSTALGLLGEDVPALYIGDIIETYRSDDDPDQKASSMMSTTAAMLQIPMMGDCFTLASDAYYIVKTPEANTTTTVYIEPANISRSLFRSQQPPFTLTVESGEYVEEDGKLIITGNAVLKLHVNSENAQAIIHAERSDGETMEYPVASVPEHTCSSKHMLMSPPTDELRAVQVEICEICGKTLRSSYLNAQATAMLSNGHSYQDIRGAVADAAESEEEMVLTIWGNINITEDLNIPENLNLVIAPGTVISVKDGCNFTADGIVKDYSDSEEKPCVNLVLNYWNGKTEILRVAAGTEVTALPALGNEACGEGGWYVDEARTEPFEAFVAGETRGPHYYYAQSQHQFAENGRCSDCGELKNGKDSFSKLYVSLGKTMKLNVTIILTEAAMADDEAYVLFKLGNGGLMKQLLLDAQDNGDGTYTFSCPLNPLYFEDAIRVQIHYSDGTVGTKLTYSVKEYFDTLLANAEQYDADTLNLVKTVMNYVGAVQKYEGMAADVLFNRDLPVGSVENVTLSNAFKTAVISSGSNVSAETPFLTIGAQMTMKVPFTLAEGADLSGYRLTMDGKTVQASQEGQCYTISITGIDPTEFGTMHVFKIRSKTDAEDYAEIRFCPYSYANDLFAQAEDDASAELAQAIANYGEAVLSFRNRNH